MTEIQTVTVEATQSPDVIEVLSGAPGIQGPQGPPGIAGPHTHPVTDVTGLQAALNAKEGTIAAGTTSQYFRGDKTWQSLTPAAVGLGNVNNTTDLLKPISTATQAALNLKAPLASPTFTGTVGGITKAMVGLANVDNTTDLLKPVSTATQTALDTKSDKVWGTSNAPVRVRRDIVQAMFNAVTPSRYYRINTNVFTNSSVMIKVRIKGYSFNSVPSVVDGWFTAYMYNTVGGTVYQPKWYNLGDIAVTVSTYKDANNKLVIVLDPVSLSYPRFSVDEVEIGLASSSDSEYIGWTITNVADLTDLGTAFPMSGNINLYQTLLVKENSVAAGTTAQYYRGDKTWQTLNATAVGLANVNNTSDLAKPISTATQTALNAKVSTTGNETIAGIKTFSSAPVVPTGSFTVANTTGLQSAIDSKAPTVHGHALSDANITGTLPLAQLPAHGHALSDANMTGTLPLAQLPAHTHPYVPTLETRTSAQLPYRMELNYAIDTANPNIHEVKDSRGEVITWNNEAGQYRFRNPYSTWADSGVRGVIEPGDYTGTALGGGNFIELVNRNIPDVAANRKVWGIRWATGKTIRNGVEAPDVFMRQAASDPIPSTVPADTIVVTLDGEKNLGGTVAHSWSTSTDTFPQVTGTVALDATAGINAETIKITNDANPAYTRFALDTVSKVSVRFYMKTPTAWPANAVTIAGLRPTISTLTASIFLTGTALPGRLRLIKTGGLTVAESPAILALNTWYRVELRYDATRSMSSLVVYELGEDVAKWNSGMRIDPAFALPVIRADIGRLNATPAMNDWYLDGVELLAGAFGPVGRHSADTLSPTAQAKPPYAGALSFWDGTVLWGILNH